MRYLATLLLLAVVIVTITIEPQSDVIARAEQHRGIQLAAMTPALSPSKKVTKVDRKAIVAYAYAWTTKKKPYNPAYRRFTNDCTNFVSQALRAGGWRDVGPSIGSLIVGFPHRSYPNDWWYLKHTPDDRWGQSLTWNNANSFFVFINASGRADLTLKLKNLEPGDVLLADWTFDFDVDHAMIVTRKDQKDIYLTYHSGPGGKPVVDKPLSEIKKDHAKYAAYYGYRLRSSY
jgi:hypothetical protein